MMPLHSSKPKMLHKFYNQNITPWVKLIWDTYYSDAIPHATAPCGSFWWRELVKLMPTYRGVTKVLINDGRSILFWKDEWNQHVLEETFPRAFSYTTLEDASVQKCSRLQIYERRFTYPSPYRLMKNSEPSNRMSAPSPFLRAMTFGSVRGEHSSLGPQTIISSSSMR